MRETMERHQAWIYLAAITLGLVLGSAVPTLADALERLLWPTLVLLLYVTFTQIKLAELPAAFKDFRFTAAALLGNFLVLPLLVWGVLLLVPADPIVRLGLVLVLLVPCTDWFITFTHQARGDTRRAITITPSLLLAQMVLLPLYLWLFMGPEFMVIGATDRMLVAFMVVIVIPLVLAYVTTRWAGKLSQRARAIDRLGAWPVPLLAVVLLLIAATQVDTVLRARHLFGIVALACLGFLVGAVALALLVGRLFRLPTPQARTLLFSMTTRNSFVVLPFALALPAHQQAAAVVIVLQSLIELLGMMVLLGLVRRQR